MGPAAGRRRATVVASALAAVAGLGMVGAPSAGAAMTLTKISSVSLSPGTASVAFSAKGTRLAAVNREQNTLTMLAVAATGALSKISGATVTTGPGSRPTSVAFGLGGGQVAVAAPGTNRVRMYPVRTDGTFGTSVPTAVTSPTVVAFAPGGGLLAVATSARRLALYQVRTDGKLVAVPGGAVTIAGGSADRPRAIVFSRDGKRLQVRLDGCRCVRSFTVAVGGGLTASGGAVAAPAATMASATSPGGRLLASVQPGRGLSLLTPGTLGVLAGPTTGGGFDAVDVASDGFTVAVADARSGAVSSYGASPADKQAPAVVGTPYAGLRYVSGQIRSGTPCTLTSPCAWKFSGLPGGLRVTPAQSGGATVTITGTPLRAGVFRGGGQLFKFEGTVAAFRWELRVTTTALPTGGGTGGVLVGSGGVPPGVTVIGATSGSGGSLQGVGGTGGTPSVGPPTVTITAPAADARYRRSDPIRADYSCGPGTNGALAAGAAGCAGTIASGVPLTDGPAGTRTLTVTATGADGQTTTLTRTYVVVEPPSSLVSVPAGGGRYAQGTTVPADFSCAAGTGGTLAAGTDGCAGTVPEGAAVDTAIPGAHSFSATATDTLGQSATSTSTYTVVGPPTASVVTPAAGATYALGQAVTADYACAPGEQGELKNGVAGCAGTTAQGAALDTTTPGTKTLSVTVTDTLGQTRSVTRTYTVVGPPSATITTPPAGAVYAVGQTVTVAYSCAAAAGGTLAAGTAGCSGTVADGAAIDTATPGTKTISVTATDTLGQTWTTTRNYLVAVPPTVTVDAPVQNATYATGFTYAAAFACAAGTGAAIVSCVGPVADGAPFDTSAPQGTRTFTVTATDDLGQVTSRTITYKVADPA